MLEQITGFANLVFSPLNTFPPYLAVFIFSIVITVLLLGLNRVLTNKKLMNELKVKMEEIKENLTKAQKAGNEQEANRLLNDMMTTNSQYMKQTYKSLIVSFVIAIIFLPWLTSNYSGAVVTLPFSIPIVGSSLNGLYWYIFVSLVVGWVINKTFGGYH